MKRQSSSAETFGSYIRDLRIAADNGKPLFEENPDHKISKIFLEIAKKIKGSFL